LRNTLAGWSSRPPKDKEQGETKMRKQKGFSLIELLIVVAIILIIAAIAIPNLLRARIAANESSAAASVRTIDTAELTYQSSYQVYAPTLAALGPAAATGCTTPASSAACIIDYSLGNASTAATAKSGFVYNATLPATAGQYYVDASPATVNTTGVKEFCSVEDNVVRFVNPSTGINGIAGHDNCVKLTAIGN
jgi:type IV pilus assembly protein PilA